LGCPFDATNAIRKIIKYSRSKNSIDYKLLI
jgi:hypothetical protein